MSDAVAGCAAVEACTVIATVPSASPAGERCKRKGRQCPLANVTGLGRSCAHHGSAAAAPSKQTNPSVQLRQAVAPASG